MRLQIFPLLFLLLLSSGRVAAIGDLTQSKNIAETYNQTKEELIDEEMRQREVLAELYNINKRMKKISREKTGLTNDKFALQSNIGSLAKMILQLESDTNNLKKKMRSRLLALYKSGGQGIVRVLLSSNSAHDLDRNVKIITKVADRDLQIIKNYIESGNTLKKQKADLSLKVQKFESVEKDLRGKENNLTSEQNNKMQVLSRLKNSYVSRLQKLKGLRKQSMLLNELLKPSMFEKKGLLPMPIKGEILHNFGLLKDTTHRTLMRHKGFFITADVGAPVSSIFDGEVAFAGYIVGFGYTIIIDHGDHYYSVYAHNSQLLVKPGMSVLAQQTIARSGATAEEFGPGLYFEIRHFSEPDDPAVWIKPDEVILTSSHNKESNSL